jgi:hypothetical protein
VAAEQHSALAELIQVGRPHQRMPVAAQVGPQVVYGDKENVGLSGCLLCLKVRGSKQKKKYKEQAA